VRSSCCRSGALAAGSHAARLKNRFPHRRTPTASTSVTGCTPAEAQQAIDAYKNAQGTLDQFDDVRAGANEAGTDALPALIAELQRLSTQAKAIKLPACAQPSTGHLAGSIDGVAQALSDAQAGKPESDIQARPGSALHDFNRTSPTSSTTPR
jgi:hypothetical protein